MITITHNNHVYAATDVEEAKKILVNLENEIQDRVIAVVCDDLKRRSELGIKKYGMTLERGDLTLDQWLEHAYMEALDMANYLKRSIMEIRGEFWGHNHTAGTVVIDGTCAACLRGK